MKRLVLEPVGWPLTIAEAPAGPFCYDWEVYPGERPTKLLGFKGQSAEGGLAPCFDQEGRYLNLRPDHEVQPVKALWVED